MVYVVVLLSQEQLVDCKTTSVHRFEAMAAYYVVAAGVYAREIPRISNPALPFPVPVPDSNNFPTATATLACIHLLHFRRHHQPGWGCALQAQRWL